MSVNELQQTLAHTQNKIAIADEIEQARIDAKKSASKSPSRSRRQPYHAAVTEQAG